MTDRLFTIGHSTLALESFLQGLADNGCTTLVDVRSHPGSRRYPHFGKKLLADSLDSSGIQFIWREGLGGWRSAQKESINGAWRNASFRGYADYMQEPVFEHEVDWLLNLPGAVAIMCSEAVPWRCHRSMIADAATVRGVHVDDIYVKPNGSSWCKPHVLRDFARTEGNRVWYPSDRKDSCHLN